VDIICSEKRTVSREHSSGKTVSFEEQIMSKDKYPSIGGYCVYYPSNIYCNTPSFENWGIFSWGIFGHMMRLDQLLDYE